MKRAYLYIVLLLVLWAVAYFIYHTGPATHTLIGISFLLVLHTSIFRERVRRKDRRKSTTRNDKTS